MDVLHTFVQTLSSGTPVGVEAVRAVLVVAAVAAAALILNAHAR